LKKRGLKFRRTGLVPGKALDDKKQQETQQDFHDNKRQPILEEAKGIICRSGAFCYGGLFRQGLVFHASFFAIKLWAYAL